MKTQLILILFSLVCFGSYAQKRTIDVKDFSELSLGIPGTLYLTQGSNESVEIECSDSAFDKIEFELSGDRLTIKRKDRGWSWSNSLRGDIDIYVTMKDIERLSVSGSGFIEGQNTINTRDLTLSISGSGDMELDLDGDEVETRISGSGSIILEGQAERTESRISGSGKVKAEDLSVRTYKASISGSGSCYITASEEVIANISGSGTVYYKGNPDKVISNSSGSGKIRKL